MLIHGTVDDAENCWRTKGEGAKEASEGFSQRLEHIGFKVFVVDYGDSSGDADQSSFKYNCKVVWDGMSQAKARKGQGIDAALKASRADGFAATQADVIGHSMGGVLVRVYASDSYTGNMYHRKENFGRGTSTA